MHLQTFSANVQIEIVKQMVIRSLKYRLFELLVLSLLVVIFTFADDVVSIGGELLLALIFYITSLYPFVKTLFDRFLRKDLLHKFYRILLAALFPIIYFPTALLIFGFSVEEVLQRAFMDTALFPTILLSFAAINAHDVATN
jgi:hypothetical protein